MPAGAFDEEKCVAICEALLKRMDEVQNVEVSDGADGVRNGEER